MVNVTRTLTRAQIAKIVGNDQEAIRAFEALVATGQTVSATTFNLLVARVSSLEGRVDGLDVDVAVLEAEVDVLEAEVDALIAGDGVSAVRTVTVDDSPTAADDVILADAALAAILVSLPAAATMTGRRLEIKKIDATANTVTIDPDGAETIDGSATQIISTQYSSRTVLSDGTEWWIL